MKFREEKYPYIIVPEKCCSFRESAFPIALNDGVGDHLSDSSLSSDLRPSKGGVERIRSIDIDALGGSIFKEGKREREKKARSPSPARSKQLEERVKHPRGRP